MKLRILLKTSLMLALVIAGRFARDIERTNPGRSLNEIIRTSSASTVTPGQPTAIRPPMAAPKRLKAAFPAYSRSQSASFSDVN